VGAACTKRKIGESFVKTVNQKLPFFTGQFTLLTKLIPYFFTFFYF